MIVRYTKLLFPLIMVLASLPVAAEEPDKLRWFYPDWRPAFLEHYDEGESKGFGDKILSLVQENLPGYRHSLLKVNWARWEKMLEAGQDSCFSSGFYEWPDDRGELRTDIVWSGPYLIFNYHGVVMHKQHANKFSGQIISLETLIKDQSLKMLLEDDRMYSGRVQDLLERYRDKVNLSYRPAGRDSTGGVMRMLALGRADYSLEYPLSFEYNAKKAGVLDQLTILPIQEHQDLFGYVSTTCTNTPAGRRVIATINKNLELIRQSNAMKSIARECCILPGQEKQFWQEWQQMLLSKY